MTELLGLGSEALSLSGMAITVGMCIGGIVYPYISRDKNPRHIIVMGGLILSGGYMLSSAGPFFAGNPIGAYGLCAVYAFCMGFGVAMASSSFSNLFMSNVPENYLSRATGIINAIGTAAMPGCFISDQLYIRMGTGANNFAFIRFGLWYNLFIRWCEKGKISIGGSNENQYQ